MVKIAHFNAGGVGSIPAREAKIPHALGPKTQNIEKRNNVVMNSIKTLKMVHIKKILKENSFIEIQLMCHLTHPFKIKNHSFYYIELLI